MAKRPDPGRAGSPSVHTLSRMHALTAHAPTGQGEAILQGQGWGWYEGIRRDEGRPWGRWRHA